MAQEFSKKFYNSAQWERCRSQYLITPIKRPFGVVPPGLCERCYEMGLFSIATIVHHRRHITPANVNDPNVTIDFDNLQRLCPKCHAEVHSGNSKPRVIFRDGEPVKAKDESMRSLVMRLTESDDERRNIHRRTNG